MDADPMQFVEEDDDKQPVSKESAANVRARLNSMVAISVALLATFMAICKVKDDNIVQHSRRKPTRLTITLGTRRVTFVKKSPLQPWSS